MSYSNYDRDIAAAVAGDKKALERLLSACAGTLKGRITCRLRYTPVSDYDAEDILQDINLDVVKGIHSFRQESTVPFISWINKIADNRIATIHRVRNCQKRGSKFKRNYFAIDDKSRLLIDTIVDSESNSPSQMMRRNEVLESLGAALHDLPRLQRDAIRTYFLDGQSLNSTARALDRSEAAVRGLIHRAKQRMRTSIAIHSQWTCGEQF